MIAGTRQQSRFYALMNDYDRTLELVAEGSNSSGKASQQFSLYQDSLTSSTKGLSNELEKLRNNLIQEDSLIHNITKALTALLKIINKSHIHPEKRGVYGNLLIWQIYFLN